MPNGKSGWHICAICQFSWFGKSAFTVWQGRRQLTVCSKKCQKDFYQTLEDAARKVNGG